MHTLEKACLSLKKIGRKQFLQQKQPHVIRGREAKCIQGLKIKYVRQNILKHIVNSIYHPHKYDFKIHASLSSSKNKKKTRHTTNLEVARPETLWRARPMEARSAPGTWRKPEWKCSRPLHLNEKTTHTTNLEST